MERREGDRRAGAAQPHRSRAGRPQGWAVPPTLYDPDTGLASRVLFRERTAHALTRAARGDSKVAVLVLEISAAPHADAVGADRSRVGSAVARLLRPEDTVTWLDDGYVGVLVDTVENLSVAQAIRRRLQSDVTGCSGSSVALSDSQGRVRSWMSDAP